jgi:uncharacterized membrane protein YfcA
MDILPLLAVLSWGVVVGIVFSAIGAAGGILASFGLITLFGVLEPNSVKPMAQLIVLATVSTFVPGYLRRSALVLPLGLLLGCGGLIGAYAGSTLSTHYLSDMQTFRPFFGLLTLGVAAQIIWNLLKRWNSDRPDGEATGRAQIGRVGGASLTFRTLTFHYNQKDYSVPTWSPIVAGLVIAMAASTFGVGGGFLLVPYMASVLAMPMHIIPATAAIAIFMSLFVSISNFLALGAPLHSNILLPLVIGAIAGAIVGPRINKAMKNHRLQITLAIVVMGIGLKYTLF